MRNQMQKYKFIHTHTHELNSNLVNVRPGDTRKTADLTEQNAYRFLKLELQLQNRRIYTLIYR